MNINYLCESWVPYPLAEVELQYSALPKDLKIIDSYLLYWAGLNRIRKSNNLFQRLNLPSP
jgi:hypothetical protein